MKIASIITSVRNRIATACLVAMAVSTPILTAQIKVTFNGDGDSTTPSGTITVNLGDNTATLSNLTGTMGIGAPSVSGGLGGVSGSFDVSFQALGTIAENFNPADFTGGAADGVFTTATEWAVNSDINTTANNVPGQGIVFTFDFTNLVGAEGIDLTAVRWQNNSNGSRLNFLDEGLGTSVPLYPSENASATPLSSDQTVQFIVPQALDTDDQVGFWSDGSGQKRLKEFTFNFVPDGITAPVNLVGTTDGGMVDLDWSDDLSGTLASYSVYRSEVQGGPYGTAIATGVLTSDYSDTTVVTGTTYYYVVTATDTEATESGFSNELEITPVIQAPTNLTAIPNDTVVNLDWDDNLSTVFASFSVYRSEVPGGPYETPIITGLTTSEYSDTTVTNETTYFYVVRAVDNITADESVDSAEVAATPFMPVLGSALYIHLDATVEDSLTLDEFGEIPEKVLTWADLTSNLNDATAGPGTVLYPSSTVSPLGLPGLDMGTNQNVLSLQDGAAQDLWLDFSNNGLARRYSGFAVFVAVTADSILAGSNRDVVMSSVESKFRLGYEAGRPQLLLDNVRLEGPTVVGPGDSVILGVNYDAATGLAEIWDSLSGTTTSITVPAGDFSEPRDLFLGGSVNGNQYMAGMIGEVKVYRGAMTPTEFADERNALSLKWIGDIPDSGFSTWISGTFANGSVPQDQQGPDDDFDQDGISNLLEFAIAGEDPTVPNGSVGTFTGDSLSFTKREDASALTYAITESTDLGELDDWTEVVSPNYVNDVGMISITFTPGTPPKNFLRLEVTE